MQLPCARHCFMTEWLAVGGYGGFSSHNPGTQLSHGVLELLHRQHSITKATLSSSMLEPAADRRSREKGFKDWSTFITFPSPVALTRTTRPAKHAMTEEMSTTLSWPG